MRFLLGRKWTAVCLAAVMGVPASAQINIDTDDAEVQIGGGEGIEVTTEQDRSSAGEAATDRERLSGRESMRRGARTSMWRQTMDQQLAQWLIVDQQTVIELAEYGLQQTQTAEVRQLAETVKQDHQQLLQRLQTFLTDQRNRSPEERRPRLETTSSLGGRDVPPVADEANAERRQQRREVREEVRDERREAREFAADQRRAVDGERPLENLADRVEDGAERIAQGARNTLEVAREEIDARVDGDQSRRQVRADQPTNARTSPWVQLHTQIAQQASQHALQTLQNRQGEQFDSAFVGLMIAAHLQEQATLEAMQNRASGELQPVLESALQTTEQHTQKAKQVMQAIE